MTRSLACLALRFPSLAALVVLVALLAGGLWVTPGEAVARTFDIVENDDVDFDFSTRRGLRLRFREPDLSFRVGGRLHLDGLVAGEDEVPIDSPDGDLRRARLYLAGEALDLVRFKVDREFAPDRKGWRNVWIGFRLPKRTQIKVGNFVAPFGLEDPAASNYSTFLERAVSSAIAPSFQTGVLVHSSGRFGRSRSRQRWTAAAAFTSEPLGQASDDRHGTEHLGFASRVTWAPLAKKRRVVHFGASFEYRDLRGDNGYRITSRPEVGIITYPLRTGSLADVDSVVSYGLDSIGLFGSLTLQGEFMQSFVQRNGRDDPSFLGGYVQASYVLTGERRRYSRSQGVLLGVKPRSAWGAVELGVRASTLDLQDAGVDGGRTRDLTVGLNWYIRENVRLMFNYVAVDAEVAATGRTDRPHIGLARFMVFF
ncbi:MAG TPA: porin [Myxococcota bacterium]|nr:porin [Myxococcota bacterium]